MTDLQRALYQFAQENRVYPLLHPEQQELRDEIGGYTPRSFAAGI